MFSCVWVAKQRKPKKTNEELGKVSALLKLDRSTQTGPRNDDVQTSRHRPRRKKDSEKIARLVQRDVAGRTLSTGL